jgi:hypothetical protein
VGGPRFLLLLSLFELERLIPACSFMASTQRDGKMPFGTFPEVQVYSRFYTLASVGLPPLSGSCRSIRQFRDCTPVIAGAPTLCGSPECSVACDCPAPGLFQ